MSSRNIDEWHVLDTGVVIPSYIVETIIKEEKEWSLEKAIIMDMRLQWWKEIHIDNPDE